VHTLKGNAAQLGETKLQNTARTIEEMLSEDGITFDQSTIDMDLITNVLMKDLESDLKSILARLEPLMSINENENLVQIDVKEQTLEILDTLEKLIIDNDTDCFLYLDNLKAIPGGDKPAGFIEDYDFKKALEALTELRNKIST
jgi:HPt (histidine-containing phosphotransfer) domain-containing protein